MKLNRYLASLVAAVLVFTVGHSETGVDRKQRVTSDVARLRTTLLLPLEENVFKSTEMGSGGFPLFSNGQPRGALAQHRALRGVLQSHGVRILDLFELLDSATQNARAEGTLEASLAAIFPATAEQIRKEGAEIDAASVFLRRDDHFYRHHADGTLDPLFPGMSSMYWARDFAASTPKGIVIGNSRRYSRSLENKLIRFIFKYADPVRDVPIVFDAEAEGVHLDGGDFIVLDEETLLLGVGNRTSTEAAVQLAKKLDMDVLAVALPSWEKRSGLSRQLLHLDTTFNLVDARTILAVPFFLEKRYNESNPMKNILLGIQRQMQRINDLEGSPVAGNPASLTTTVEQMSEVGWLTRYAAGTGVGSFLGLKLVDYFRSQGYKVVYVGGDRGEMDLEKYVLERAMYELRWQGGNVVQLGPGEVIAYEHNIYTNRALEAAGIKVHTFPGELLAIRNGGPHCLLMPLTRFN